MNIVILHCQPRDESIITVSVMCVKIMELLRVSACDLGQYFHIVFIWILSLPNQWSRYLIRKKELSILKLL